MSKRPKTTFSTKLNSKYIGAVKPFWTQKEYEYQDLSLNGFVIQRELPGYYKSDIPHARVDLYYDTPEGLGQKRINGVEIKVYREATKFLNRGELTAFNSKWTKAKYEGKYNYEDPKLDKDISDETIPAWHTDPIGWNKKDKKNDFIDSPLQDILLTNNIDPKDLAVDGGLSSLYNYIQGKRELPKSKAEEYAKLLGLAPQTLMFDTKMIPCWGFVNLHKQTADVHSNRYAPGEIRYNEDVYTVACPAELYRYDIKAIQIDFDKTAYHGMLAYYYETSSNDATALNNKICMIRTYEPLEDEKGNKFGPDKGYYKYYLGIYQIYGTKKRILNLDPTSDVKVLADDIDIDLIAPIAALVRPAYMDLDAGLRTPNIENIQKLSKLIKEDEKLKLEQQKKSKLTEAVNQLILDRFYENKKEKLELQRRLDKQLTELKKLQRRNSEIKNEVGKYLKYYIDSKEAEDLDLYKNQTKAPFLNDKINDLTVEFKARKKRA
jgi:hypothetical protein